MAAGSTVLRRACCLVHVSVQWQRQVAGQCAEKVSLAWRTRKLPALPQAIGEGKCACWGRAARQQYVGLSHSRRQGNGEKACRKHVGWGEARGRQGRQAWMPAGLGREKMQEAAVSANTPVKAGAVPW